MKTRTVSDVCFACGPGHPTGLHLRFEPSSHGGLAASWEPEEAWQGFPGVIHGGIVSTVLDEAMAKAAAVFSHRAMTAEITVRFRRPVSPGQQLCVRGWVVELSPRRLQTEAAICASDGLECAHARGTFLPVRGL